MFRSKPFYTRPITAEGFYDESYESNQVSISCVSSALTYPFIREPAFQNPLTGTGDLQNPATDKSNNDNLEHNEANYHEVESSGGINYFNLPYLGHSRQSFHLGGNYKIGMGTNPSTCSLINMVSYNTAPNGYNNVRHSYLNGLSIEIINQYSNGDTKVRVKFDDIDINNDVRWCSPSIILNPITSPSGFSLNLKTGKTMTLDQGLTPIQIDNPIIVNGKKAFTTTTVMTLKSNAIVNLEPNSYFIVDNNSKLVLESNSTIIIRSGAELRIKRGGTLILNSNANLNVENGGRVIIEDDASFDYYQNADLVLTGNTSVCEIKGMLNLQNDATFRFTSSSSQKGYLVFSNTSLFPSRNITAGNNCRIDLWSNSSNNKILEINQETFYAPANLVQLRLNSGRVEFNSNSRLQADGLATIIDFNNVRFTSNTPGLNNGHRGVHLYGQSNVSISICTFEFGRYGIYAYQTYGGAPLNLVGCTFRHNTFGIRAYDKGLGLYQCNFFNNDWGVSANQMSFPSLFFEGLTGGGVANRNRTGIKWQGNSTTSLTLNNPLINTNNTGVRVENCPHYVKCGSISYNNDGIVFASGANLFMDDHVITPNTAANVSVFNNNTSIRAYNGWYLWLNKGGNELLPSSSNNQKTVYGSLLSPPYGILANSNMWNSSGTLSSLDYYLGTSYTIVDNNIQTSITGCGQAIPPCPTPPCPNQSPIEYCPTCDIINTDDFSGVKLNIATKDAIAKLNSTDPNKYKDAVSLFYQILNEQYINPDDKEKYLLSLNYVKMMEALGNAFKYNQIVCTETGLPEIVTQVISIQDKLIEIAIGVNNHDTRFKYSMDKAQTLRLACRREECVQLLNQILEWCVGDAEINAVNVFICQVGIENMVLNGTILPSDVEEQMTSCNQETARLRNDDDALEILNPPAVNLSVDIYNNSQFNFIDVKTNAENGHLIMLNSIGEIVHEENLIYDCSIDVNNFSKGIYIINVTDKNTGESLGNKLVLN